MKKNLKSLEGKLIKIKVQLDMAPKEMKRNFGWQLLKETLYGDFDEVIWFYSELSAFVDERFGHKGKK